MRVGNQRNRRAQLQRHLSVHFSSDSGVWMCEEQQSGDEDGAWRCVRLADPTNDEKGSKYLHIWVYFCGRDHASSRDKQIGRSFECPRVFSSTVPTPVAPNPLPWCFADGTLGNIPGGGCNKGDIFPGGTLLSVFIIQQFTAKKTGVTAHCYLFFPINSSLNFMYWIYIFHHPRWTSLGTPHGARGGFGVQCINTDNSSWELFVFSCYLWVNFRNTDQVQRAISEPWIWPEHTYKLGFWPSAISCLGMG